MLPTKHEELSSNNIEDPLQPWIRHKGFCRLYCWTLPARSLSLISLLVLLGSFVLFIIFPLFLEPLLARRGIPNALAVIAPLITFWVVYSGRNRPNLSLTFFDFFWHPRYWGVFLTGFSFLVSILFFVEPLISKYVLPLGNGWDVPWMKHLKTILDNLLPVVFANFFASLVLLPRLIPMRPNSSWLLHITQLSLAGILIILVSMLMFLENFVYPIIEWFDPAKIKVVTTNTEGADVFVDGKWKGKTPLHAKLQRGDHTVCVSKPGYLHYQHNEKIVLTDKDGKLYDEVTLALKEAEAEISIKVNQENVQVYLGDKDFGIFSGSKLLKTKIGEQIEPRLKLVKSGYLSFEQTLQLTQKREGCIDDVSHRVINVELRYPKLNLTSENETGEFLITVGDIKRRATFPYEAAFPVGEYLIRAEKDGYIPCQHQVNLNADKSLTCQWKPLSIQSDADEVKINGTSYRSLPISMSTPVGTQLVVEKQGNSIIYAPCEFTVTENVSGEISCYWPQFYLHSNSPVGSDEVVTINGTEYGETPLRLPLNQSPSGSYEIWLKRSKAKHCKLNLVVKKAGLPEYSYDKDSCKCYYWRTEDPFRLRCELN